MAEHEENAAATSPEAVAPEPVGDASQPAAPPEPQAAPEPPPTQIQSLLRSLAGRVPPELIDQVWVFPARLRERSETAVVVATAFHPDDPERRRVLTAHYLARRGEKGKMDVQEMVLDHAVAPAERLPAVIEGVVRRLDDDLAALEPKQRDIGGDVEAWLALLEELGPTA